MDLDIKVYDAQYKQRLKDAEAAKKAGLAAATARFNEEKAAADLMKKQRTAELAASLKSKSMTKAEYDASIKELNSSYGSMIKDANALKSTLTKEANTGYTTSVADAKTFLADSKSAIAAEQKRLKDQFTAQTKLSSQAQKEALANLAFERALYTKADYDKKVADIKNDFGRINEALDISYKTVQTLPAERREEYLAGGIGSLAKAQEMLAKSRQTSKAEEKAKTTVSVPTAPVTIPTTSPVTTPAVEEEAPAAVQTTPVPTPEVAPSPVRVPFAELQQQAQEKVQAGIQSPLTATPGIGATIPTGPVTPLIPASPTAAPGDFANPYEGVFGGKQQFPYLQNPYMSMFPGMQPAEGEEQTGQEGQPSTSPLLFDPNYAPPTTGLQLSQTPPPPSAPVDYMQFLQNNPYLAAYQNAPQGEPQEEEVVSEGGVAGRPIF